MRQKSIKPAGLILTLTTIFFILLIPISEKLSIFGQALFALGFTIFIIALIDKYLLIKYDILKEIFEKQNIAVALVLGFIMFCVVYAVTL